MLSLAEEDKKKQEKIIRIMTYNEVLRHALIMKRKILTWNRQ
jgi:hypothetical protein